MFVGRIYTDHAVTRMNERGFTPTVIENAIRSGQICDNKVLGRLTHYDSLNNISVITEKVTGVVVTIFNGLVD
ncbi:MAG: DUF4258 domain-containing protein [bacterium]